MYISDIDELSVELQFLLPLGPVIHLYAVLRAN